MMTVMVVDKCEANESSSVSCDLHHAIPLPQVWPCYAAAINLGSLKVDHVGGTG